MPVKISAKGGKKNRSSKIPRLLHTNINEPKIIFKKSSIFNSNQITYYNDLPSSEIDEIICQGKDEIGNDIYFIKLKNQSYKNRKHVKRKEFKNYFNGEQIFNYFSKLTIRKTFNQLFLVEEKILHCISTDKRTSYLVKWAFLPISFSTWEENVSPKLIEKYQNRDKIRPPKKIDINIDSIQISDKYDFNPVQVEVVKNIIQNFTKNFSHFSLLGGIGSIMRKEIYASIDYIQNKFSCNYPILFIVDEDLVSIIKTEIENFLGKFCLSINYDTNEIDEIQEYGWFYPGTNNPIYQTIVISFDAFPLMIDFIQKTNFLLICADATSNKANSNTISNLLSDFADDEEMPKPKEEKEQLRLIEDYLKISNLNSFLVISLLPFFFHSPTNNFFIDSFCEPSNLCQEEFIVCNLTQEQRKEYDETISNHIGELNQSLVDCLNLIIDHPAFNYNDFSIDKISENDVWPFILRSGKMLILHEFIKKAIFEEKRTLIITANEFLFNLLKKYFKLIDKQYEILDKESTMNSNSKFQFILALINDDDLFPWSSLELDWILCLSPFINPIYRNSNWGFVLSKSFVVKKTTIFRFFVEDTFETFLAVDSTSSNINERPNILYFLRSTFDYPIRLLVSHCKIFPYLLLVNQPQMRSYINNESEIEPDYIGDFEPCMLEKANSIMIPTTTLQIEFEQKGQNKITTDDEGKKIVTHFLQYSEQNHKLIDALYFENSNIINQDWSEETIGCILRIISTVCWGNWDLMSSKMPIEIKPGLMKNVAYLFLDHLLKISDREYKIAQTFVSKFVPILDKRTSQLILSSIVNYMRNYAQNELNCRLDRIEDMMVLTMILARCNVNNLPSDIYIPKNFHEYIPSSEWKTDKDKKLLYAVYCNGYNSFGSDFIEFNFASLSCRFHALIQAFIPEIPKITGYKSVERSKPISKGKNRPSKSLVKISKKSPASSQSSQQQNETKKTKKVENVEKNVWTKQEQKDFTELLLDFGPNLDINDFRSLIPLDKKTDKDIITLKTKLIEYEKSGICDKYVFQPPARESLQSSFDFFKELDELNLDEFYCEDQSTIKAMKFWGIKRATNSPLLQSVFGTNLFGFSKMKVELEKIKNRKIKKEAKQKSKFRIKLKYRKSDNSDQNTIVNKSKLNDESKIESNSNTNSENNDEKIDFPYNTIQGRTAVYPVTVCNNISIISIGHINSSPEFSNSDFIYPDGYAANCIFNGMELSCLIRNKNNSPVFRVVNPSNRAKMTSNGKTPEEAWYNFFVNILKISTYSFDLWRVPGHELFGLCSPLTKRLIQALPGASECRIYKPVAFLTPLKDIEYTVLLPENRFLLNHQNKDEQSFKNSIEIKQKSKENKYDDDKENKNDEFVPKGPIKIKNKDSLSLLKSYNYANYRYNDDYDDNETDFNHQKSVEFEIKEPIKLRNKNRTKSKYRRIDNLLDEKSADSIQENAYGINENTDSIDENVDSIYENENKTQENADNVKENIDNIHENIDNIHENIDNIHEKTNKIHENVDNIQENAANDETEKSEIPFDKDKNESIEKEISNQDVIKETADKRKRKIRTKLSDFDSSDNENKEEDQSIDQKEIEKHDEELENFSPPPPLPFSEDQEEENGADFQTEDEELQPQEKPDLPPKKEKTEKIQPKKSKESIYSYYKDSEDETTNNEDSDDSEFYSRSIIRQQKASLLQNSLSQSSQKRGRKPKSLQNEQRRKSNLSPPPKLKNLSITRRRTEDEDEQFEKESDKAEDDIEDETERKKKDKNDKAFIYPFKNFEFTNTMRTRSSESREKTKKKKIKLYEEKNKKEEESNKIDFGSQLVMRPNFNSRRKKPKEPVVYGNWIESIKKSNDIEKVTSPSSPSSSPIQSKSDSKTSSNKNAELHFNFSMLANRMEKAGGIGKTEISFGSKDLFKHINPAAHPDSFKHELKKFGDSILNNSSEIRDILGFNELSASGVWKKSSNNSDQK